ncbi:MAG: AAA family ATPase [Sulfobacillus benefaciens]|uniref:AAA family ATPase n=1 Tax=Sulfobacillus benefaciens TaxID=453960 RepID=A0A2T2XKY6_9FIRM|nr:MAG: AAA family ATPase [Sulfobacillus benefaciens]
MPSGVFLRQIRWRTGEQKIYPWALPAFQSLKEIDLIKPVTFFVGDNGSGKSTLLEAIAIGCGFNPEGGNRNHQFASAHSESELTKSLNLSWSIKPQHGFFFRAESFYQFATYLEEMAQQDYVSAEEVFRPYGGASLHHKSHGEAFLALFTHRLAARQPSLYLFDEPEAALSPTGQMALLRIIHQWVLSGQVQCIIATHSPILLAYPDCTIFDFDYHPFKAVNYEDTLAYRITRQFMDSRPRMLAELFREDESD